MHQVASLRWQCSYVLQRTWRARGSPSRLCKAAMSQSVWHSWHWLGLRLGLAAWWGRRGSRLLNGSARQKVFQSCCDCTSEIAGWIAIKSDVSSWRRCSEVSEKEMVHSTKSSTETTWCPKELDFWIQFGHLNLQKHPTGNWWPAGWQLLLPPRHPWPPSPPGLSWRSPEPPAHASSSPQVPALTASSVQGRQGYFWASPQPNNCVYRSQIMMRRNATH